MIIEEEKLILVTHASQVKVSMLMELQCLCGGRHRFIVTGLFVHNGICRDASGGVDHVMDTPSLGMLPRIHGADLLVFAGLGNGGNLFIVETGLKHEATTRVAAPVKRGVSAQ